MVKEDINKPKAGQFDFILFITVLIMLGFGLIMVLSASSPTALSKGKGSYHYVLIQTISAAIGIIMMLMISKINYKVWGKLYKPMYFFSILLLLAVKIPKLGVSAGDATRWIDLGFTTFQPSELVKIAMIIFFARYLTEHKDKLGKFKDGFVYPILLVVPIIFILIFVQSHLSAAAIIGLLVVVLMLMAGTKLRYFLTVGAAGLGAGGIALYILAKFYDIGKYRLNRITAFLDPWSDPTKYRISSNTRTICDRVWRFVWSWLRK